MLLGVGLCMAVYVCVFWWKSMGSSTWAHMFLAHMLRRIAAGRRRKTMAEE